LYFGRRKLENTFPWSQTTPNNRKEGNKKKQGGWGGGSGAHRGAFHRRGGNPAEVKAAEGRKKLRKCKGKKTRTVNILCLL